jgi:hypothetical protein
MPVTRGSGEQQNNGQGLVQNAVTEDLLPTLKVP